MVVVVAIVADAVACCGARGRGGSGIGGRSAVRKPSEVEGGRVPVAEKLLSVSYKLGA